MRGQAVSCPGHDCGQRFYAKYVKPRMCLQTNQCLFSVCIVCLLTLKCIFKFIRLLWRLFQTMKWAVLLLLLAVLLINLDHSDARLAPLCKRIGFECVDNDVIGPRGYVRACSIMKRYHQCVRRGAVCRCIPPRGDVIASIGDEEINSDR